VAADLFLVTRGFLAGGPMGREQFRADEVAAATPGTDESGIQMRNFHFRPIRGEFRQNCFEHPEISPFREPAASGSARDADINV